MIAIDQLAEWQEVLKLDQILETIRKNRRHHKSSRVISSAFGGTAATFSSVN